MRHFLDSSVKNQWGPRSYTSFLLKIVAPRLKLYHDFLIKHMSMALGVALVCMVDIQTCVLMNIGQWSAIQYRFKTLFTGDRNKQLSGLTLGHNIMSNLKISQKYKLYIDLCIF